jgi:hypothetical protein
MRPDWTAVKGGFWVEAVPGSFKLDIESIALFTRSVSGITGGYRAALGEDPTLRSGQAIERILRHVGPGGLCVQVGGRAPLGRVAKRAFRYGYVLQEAVQMVMWDGVGAGRLHMDAAEESSSI